MEIPFNDVRGPAAAIKKAYLAAVEKLLDEGRFILGEEVEKFEHAWAKAMGVKYAVGASNGADAIYLALAALGIGPGDEVITQGNAYNASVTPILRVGATPRFVDIRADMLTMDIEKLPRMVNKRTRVILPVHLYGQMNDMEGITSIAKKYKLAVVEDCAQAHNAEFKGKKAGAWGDAGAFSFYPTKNLGAFGDAGAVVTHRKDLYEKMRAIRNLGQTAKNDHRYFGFNMRLDPIHAIALSLKLKSLKKFTEERMRAAGRYDTLIRQAKIPLRPVARDPRATHVYHLYVVETLMHDRKKLVAGLAARGVGTAIHYPVPVYRQPWYEGPRDPCRITDEAVARVISLPLFAGITSRAQEYVVDSFRAELKIV